MLGLLEDDADAPSPQAAPFLGREGGKVLPLKHHDTAGFSQRRVGEKVQQGQGGHGLAATRLPNQGHAASLPHFQVDAAQDGQHLPLGGTSAHLQVADLEQLSHHPPRLCLSRREKGTEV
jgi:hypothetical protein